MTLPKEPWKHPLPAQPSSSPFITPEYQETIRHLEAIFLVDNPPDRQQRWTEWFRYEMSVVHFVLLKMLERAYLFAPWAKEQEDLSAYLGFAEVALYDVYTHHHNEEHNVFPKFKEATDLDIWDRNVVEHHTFSRALHTSILYLHTMREQLPSTPTNPSPRVISMPDVDETHRIDLAKTPPSELAGLDFNGQFDPLAFQKYMENWIPLLAKHLDDELETIGPDVMARVGEKAFRVSDAATLKHLQSYDPTWFMPSVIASGPPDLMEKLLPLPLIVRKILLPFLWAPKYSDFWRYCEYPENLSFWNT